MYPAEEAAKPEPPRYLDKPEAVSADEVLPPVEAPNAGFLLQLFFVPLVIVAIIVTIWASFSWLVHSASDPKDLVRDIRALNDASWQRAYTLGDMLRNPEFDALKEDQGLAKELTEVLQQELAAAKMDVQRIKLRIYLCRILGEFRLLDVAPALVAAAQTERDPKELAVRRSAVEGLAVLAGNVGDEKLRDTKDVLDVLLKASQERAADAASAERDELRSTATFALGLVGGEEALNRLTRLLDDAHVNTRYNAATGLARRGDPRCEPVLLEMLDPANPQAIAQETKADGQARKRIDVLSAGIHATLRLAAQAPAADLTRLKAAVARLTQAEIPRAVRAQAEEAQHILNQRPQG